MMTAKSALERRRTLKYPVLNQHANVRLMHFPGVPPAREQISRREIRMRGADMTTEATLTKLMYLLGAHVDSNTVSRKFKQNLAGELTQ